MKQFYTCCILLVIYFISSGHEFWLNPDKFNFNVGDTAIIQFKVGEHFSGETWKGNRDKVNTLTHCLPDNSVLDIKNLLPYDTGAVLKLPLQKEGTHVVTYNGVNSFITLKPQEFLEYLKEDGLTNAINYRKKYKEENIDGKEFYQRSVKTILQVGNTFTNNCTQPTNLPLDIVPKVNPYNFPANNANGKIAYTIYFKKKPLANYTITYWRTNADRTVSTKTYKTNLKGEITVEHQFSKCMLSCVCIERIADKTSKANWQSYWSSLTIEPILR